MCTIPLDTAKVRLQLQRKAPQSLPPATAAIGAGWAAAAGGTLATVMSIAREEGVAALWKGIIPGLHRQFLYGGLRIGLYEPVCTSTTFTLLPTQWFPHNNKTNLPAPLAGQSFLRWGYCCRRSQFNKQDSCCPYHWLVLYFNSDKFNSFSECNMAILALTFRAVLDQLL